jgi:hypothetical protein
MARDIMILRWAISIHYNGPSNGFARLKIIKSYKKQVHLYIMYMIFFPFLGPNGHCSVQKFFLGLKGRGMVCRLHTAALALVKCSNEGGPGPRYNMKEDPGSSMFSMLVVYGYYLYLLPLFSEPGDWKNQCGPLPPPSDQPGLSTPPPPWGTYSTPCKDEGEASLSGNHTSASDSRLEAADWARGGCGDHFWAFQLFSRRSGS